MPTAPTEQAVAYQRYVVGVRPFGNCYSFCNDSGLRGERLRVICALAPRAPLAVKRHNFMDSMSGNMDNAKQRQSSAPGASILRQPSPGDSTGGAVALGRCAQPSGWQPNVENGKTDGVTIMRKTAN